MSAQKKALRGRRARPRVRDLTELGASLVVRRQGHVSLERVVRWERCVYPNGDVVTVMELA